MPEEKESRIAPKIEVIVEEIGQEPPDGVLLRAKAYELDYTGGELRRIEIPIRGGFYFRWKAHHGQVSPIDDRGEVASFRPEHEREREGRDEERHEGKQEERHESKQEERREERREERHEHRHEPFVTASLLDGQNVVQGTSKPFLILGGAGIPPLRPPVQVQLARTQHGSTRDLILWTAIRYSTESIKFANYSRFLDFVLCGDDDALPFPDDRLDVDDATFTVGEKVVKREREAREHLREEARRRRGGTGRFLSSTDAYRMLRDATDWFLRIYCGVLPPPQDFARIEADLIARVGADLRSASGARSVEQAWNAYTVRVHRRHLLPYLNIIRERLSDERPFRREEREDAVIQCHGLIEEKLEYPCFIELIWSYWQEEGMLVQTINAIANRFQNKRGAHGDRDPLLNFELDTLRPLNNLLWGYVQDDLHRLSVVRRAREYQHAYGLGLEGRAVAHLRVADRRSKFLEAFHNFLHRCLRFFQQDDDTTVIADGFPVLNAIKEVHYLLAEGFSNQYGDMPSRARAEMLIQQWLLARPEMREFLGSRRAVPYPEGWMDRVDSMKTLQGWNDTSVVHFNDLATFGEQIVLGLRFGGWSVVNDPAAAANFARDARAWIQGYSCAYRALTQMDLGADATSPQALAERDLPPSAHLKRRLLARRGA
jgi:hypothetical protein